VHCNGFRISIDSPPPFLKHPRLHQALATSSLAITCRHMDAAKAVSILFAAQVGVANKH
jgi:hypothetical protein